MFIWKECNDLFPTKMNLLKHGMVFDALCPICRRDDKTVKHILWSCLSAQDVWGCGPKKLKKCTDEGHNIYIYIYISSFLKSLWSVVT
jgi:hypothetical protein